VYHQAGQKRAACHCDRFEIAAVFLSSDSIAQGSCLGSCIKAITWQRQPGAAQPKRPAIIGRAAQLVEHKKIPTSS